MDNKKEYSGGLIRNEAWRNQRRKIITRAGCGSGSQSPLNEIQPICHNKYRQKAVAKKNEC